MANNYFCLQIASAEKLPAVTDMCSIEIHFAHIVSIQLHLSIYGDEYIHV